MVGAGLAVRKLKPDGDETVADVFERTVDRHGRRPAIVFEEVRWSYGDLDAHANRVASWAHDAGLGPGDVVALLMENRPEYLAVWLGMAKAGVTTALINTNLGGQTLRHALTVSGAKKLVLGAELAEAWSSVRADFAGALEVWASGGPVEGAADFDAATASRPMVRPPRGWRAGVTTGDPLFYIYTSGTTGNPKAAKFSHYRFIAVAAAYEKFAALQCDDRLYCVLPLYHTAGGVMTVGMALWSGACLILKRKFSASVFWDDCRRYGVTVFQYIGELCRYLLNQPERDGDRDHQVRLCVGNGLRPDIWQRFSTRFGIREIREFYGATEGSFGLINLDNRVGAVGRVPWYLQKAIPVELIRFDVESETHVRGPDGWCVRAKFGEPGEAIGRLANDGEDMPMGRFEGYTNRSDSDKKILTNVFEEGDRWYRTGDLLSRDEDGYFYFIDRIGDTFRWKGENVATSEVAEVLSTCAGVREANVYGVSVPGADGRAGMASLVVGDEFDLGVFHEAVARQLASYAQPLFVRLQRQIDTTGTFKHRKVDLVREGFDPSVVSDPLYFRDDSAGAYVPLDRALYERLAEGNLKV